MTIYYNKNNKPLAQALRRNMTPQERRLWYEFLCSYAVRFRRQKQLGRYIVDFYCSSAGIVVELDGGQHYTAEEIEYDRVRTAFLERSGLTVLRIPNNDVDEHFDAVCQWIDQKVRSRLAGQGG